MVERAKNKVKTVERASLNAIIKDTVRMKEIPNPYS